MFFQQRIAASIQALATAVRSGGGCWNLAPCTDANPKTWGAVGDGATDDTAAVQKAINYLSAGGKLNFPPGTYCIKAGPLTLTVAGITLQGRNYGGDSLGAPSPAVLSACGADVSIVNMSGKGDRLEDFRVLGSNAVGTTQPAVMLTGGVNGCNECTIRNSYIQLGFNAVYADAYEVYLEGMAADMSYEGRRLSGEHGRTYRKVQIRPGVSGSIEWVDAAAWHLDYVVVCRHCLHPKRPRSGRFVSAAGNEQWD
jgi:hypothetical protein